MDRLLLGNSVMDGMTVGLGVSGNEFSRNWLYWNWSRRKSVMKPPFFPVDFHLRDYFPFTQLICCVSRLVTLRGGFSYFNA
jgi:hypothetical protein